MLKIAIIGAGNQGKAHARCFGSNPNCEVVAVCDKLPEKAAALAEQLGVRAYESVADMVDREVVDAVSVTTCGVENGSHHFEPVMEALEAGKHVLCEKPLSNEVSQARQMVRKAREKGVKLGANLNHRFTPAAARLKQMQLDGETGETLFVNMALWFNNPNEAGEWHHIRALHPHSVDVMRFFGGDIRRVQCFMHKAPGRKLLWSTLAMNVQFASGAVGHLTGSMDMSWEHPIERCEVGASKGRAIINNVYQELEWMPRDRPEKMVLSNSIMGGLNGFEDTIKRRLDRFVEQVAAGHELDGSGEDGLAAQEVIEAAIRSHCSGRVEDVENVH